MRVRIRDGVVRLHRMDADPSPHFLAAACQMQGGPQSDECPVDAAFVAAELTARKFVEGTSQPRRTTRRPQSATASGRAVSGPRCFEGEGGMTTGRVGGVIEGVAGEACASQERYSRRTTDDLSSVLGRVGAGSLGHGRGETEQGDLLERWRSERRARISREGAQSASTHASSTAAMCARATREEPASAQPAGVDAIPGPGAGSWSHCSRAKLLKRRLARAAEVPVVENGQEVLVCGKEGAVEAEVAPIEGSGGERAGLLVGHGGMGGVEAESNSEAVSRIRRRLCCGAGGLQAEGSAPSGARGYAQRVRGQVGQQGDEEEQQSDDVEDASQCAHAEIVNGNKGGEDSQETCLSWKGGLGACNADDDELGIVCDDEEGSFSFEGEESLFNASPRRRGLETSAPSAGCQQGVRLAQGSEAPMDEVQGGVSPIVPVLLPPPRRFSMRAVAEGEGGLAACIDVSDRRGSRVQQIHDRPSVEAVMSATSVSARAGDMSGKA